MSNINNERTAHTQKRCRFCEKDHYGSQRVCGNCIGEHRPKMSTGGLIFGAFLGFIPGLIYYFVKKNKQEEGDRKNL